MAQMAGSLQWAAKARYRRREHVDDSVRKQQAAGALVRAATDRHLRPLHEKLETMRLVVSHCAALSGAAR
jgi:hypothetical protein